MNNKEKNHHYLKSVMVLFCGKFLSISRYRGKINEIAL